MGEYVPSRPLDPAEQRTFDALVVRLAHEDPQLDERLRSARPNDVLRPAWQRRFVRALVVAMLATAVATVLFGPVVGLLIGLVTLLVSGVGALRIPGRKAAR